tara:strand:- start:1949 stop:2275 length:327 start_codon:yes stop_codon:yes gene_type:complete
MPEPGERKTLNDKEFEWVATEHGGGFWSQVNSVKAAGSAALIADCCAKFRNKSENQSSLLINYDLFIYKQFNVCFSCLKYINANEDKFPEEFARIEKIRNPIQDDQEK